MKNKHTFSEKDLVLVRLNNNIQTPTGRQPHYDVWLRVLFVDTDNTFHGKIERMDDDYSLNKKGGIMHLNTGKVLDVFDEGDGRQWCYSDGITRCDCPGLCRNK